MDEPGPPAMSFLPLPALAVERGQRRAGGGQEGQEGQEAQDGSASRREGVPETSLGNRRQNHSTRPLYQALPGTGRAPWRDAGGQGGRCYLGVPCPAPPPVMLFPSNLCSPPAMKTNRGPGEGEPAPPWAQLWGGGQGPQWVGAGLCTSHLGPSQPCWLGDPRQVSQALFFLPCERGRIGTPTSSGCREDPVSEFRALSTAPAHTQNKSTTLRTNSPTQSLSTHPHSVRRLCIYILKTSPRGATIISPTLQMKTPGHREMK